MRARALIGLLAATALVALLLPGAAIARPKPASRQSHPEVSEQFSLTGTNGFEVGVSVTNRHRLVLGALRFENVLESASYRMPVHPRRGSDDIVARLGKLGRIDVRFVPGKVRREKPPKGCRGDKTVIEQGHYVGVIAFHGEHGFTEVHAHRAAAAIIRTPAQSCPAAAPPPDPKKVRRELEALEAAE